MDATSIFKPITNLKCWLQNTQQNYLFLECNLAELWKLKEGFAVKIQFALNLKELKQSGLRVSSDHEICFNYDEKLYLLLYNVGLDGVNHVLIDCSRIQLETSQRNKEIDTETAVCSIIKGTYRVVLHYFVKSSLQGLKHGL